jgi:hypothetical protein
MTATGAVHFRDPVTGGSTGVSQERGCYDIDLQLPGDDGGKIFVGIFLSLFRMIPKNVSFATNSHNMSKEMWVLSSVTTVT